MSHVNVRSLISSFQLFTDLIVDNDFTVIALSETWLSPNVSSQQLKLTDYDLVRSDRESRGGGVAFYVKSNVKYSILDIQYLPSHELEQLWIILKVARLKIAVGCAYRPPNQSITCLDELETVLSNLSLEVDEIMLVGDLNVDFLRTDTKLQYLLNILDLFNLKQIINEPTRISDTSSSLIDIICVDKFRNVLDSGTTDLLNVSDHLLVFCDLDMSIEKLPPKKITYRDYQYFNINEFAFDANRINWEYISTLHDIDGKVEFLNNAIITLFDIHAPYRTTTIRNYSKPYITDTIKEIIRLKDRAFAKYKRTSSESDKQYYKDLKNYLSIAIRNEKKAYFENRISRLKNSRNMWKQLEKYGIYSKNVNEIDSELCDPDQINNHFVNIVPAGPTDAETRNYFKINVHESVAEEFRFSPITESDLDKILRSSKSNAYGADGINLQMLKIVFPYCREQLVHIINTSLHSGYVPSIWKKTIVTPISKVHKAVTLDNLRPVSILTTLGKMLESVVFTQLTQHINQIGIMPQHQSGFRASYSTTTALSKVVNDLTCAVDRSQVTLLVLLDYTKAFDSIDHELLINKLHYYGCGSAVIEWFGSYFEDRRQLVRIKSTLSQELPLALGVPQGSILGPLLFAVFSADLPNVLTTDCSYHLYADDAQIYMSTDPLCINFTAVALNENLALLSQWSKRNGLKLNPTKSVMMCVGSVNMQHRALSLLNVSVSIDGIPLEFVECAKTLGIYLDCNLKFQTHVVKKISFCYSRFKTLYQFKHSLSAFSKWCIVNSVLLSHVEYGLCVYYPHLTGVYRNKLQMLQNSCLRYAHNIPRYDHVTPHYNQHQILKIENRFVLLFCSMLYKVLNTHIPDYLLLLLIKRSDVHNIQLRNVNSYDIPKHRTTKFKSSFSYIAASFCNRYVQSFSIDSFLVFKRKLRCTLLSAQ